MKRIFTVATAILSFLYIQAQAPQKMGFQAVIRNASNQLVVSASVGVRISILQGSAAGSSVYTETQTGTTNNNGLLTLQIGGGTVVSGTFSTINWASASYYLKTEIDPLGGTTYTVTSTSQLLSVPYALYAKSADIGSGVNANNIKVWDGSNWVNKSISTSSIGSGSAVSVRNPSLGLNYQMATNGLYPSQAGEDPFIGEIMIFAGSYTVYGYLPCDGRLLNISTYQALFAVLGVAYGGNGTSTFGLPDLRGRTPIGIGQGAGLTNIVLGDKAGQETVILSSSQLPSHTHTIVFGTP